MSEYEQLRLKKKIRQLIYKHRYYTSASWAMEEKKINRYEELLDEICIAIPEYEYAYLFDSDRDTILLNPVPYQEEKRDVNESKKEEILRAKIAEFKELGFDLAVLVEACCFDTNSRLGMYLALYGDENEFNYKVFEILFRRQSSRSMALDYCQGMSRKDSCLFERVFDKKEELVFDDDFIVELYLIQASNAEEIPRIDSAEEKIKKLFWKNDKILVIRNNFEWALKRM